MKYLLHVFLIFCFFQPIYSQCSGDTDAVFKHNLDDMDISHRSNMTFYSSDEVSAGYVLNSSDFTQTPIIYQGGIWMAGLTGNGVLLSSAKSYTDFEDYSSGLLDDIDGSITEETCANWDQVFKVSASDVSKVVQDYEEDGVVDGVIPDDVLYYPAIGNLEFVEKYGFNLPASNNGGLAPFIDRNNDGKYNAFEGDYPKIRGTESAFWISNDRNENNQNQIGMEFLVSSNINTDEVVLAFSSQMKIKAIYHGDQTLSDFYFGVWIDGDLGCLSNDKVGCLPDSNLIFYYGEESVECLEGQPFVAGTAPIMIMKHSVTGGDKMSSFISFNRNNIDNPPNGTEDPLTNTQLYNVLQGKWKDGVNMTYGNEGYNPGSTEVVSYQYNHSNNAPNGPWRACDADPLIRDKRTLVNFGPYTLTQGDIIDIDFSVHLVENAELPCPTEEDILDICREIEQVISGDKISINTSEYKVFPNPFSDMITIDVQQQDIDKIEMLDMTGKLLNEEYASGKNQIRIPTNHLQPGVYFLKFTANGNHEGIQKIVKI